MGRGGDGEIALRWRGMLKLVRGLAPTSLVMVANCDETD